jgi:hypothetical protein
VAADLAQLPAKGNAEAGLGAAALSSRVGYRIDDLTRFESRRRQDHLIVHELRKPLP